MASVVIVEVHTCSSLRVAKCVWTVVVRNAVKLSIYSPPCAGFLCLLKGLRVWYLRICILSLLTSINFKVWEIESTLSDTTLSRNTWEETILKTT